MYLKNLSKSAVWLVFISFTFIYCESVPTSGSDARLAPSEVKSLSTGIIEAKDLSVIDLGHLGGGYSIALDINERGQVVGYSSTESGDLHAFLWQDGEMIDLGTYEGGVESRAESINNKGQIVGYSRNANGDRIAILWENGEIVDLGNLGYQNSIAYSINELGQVVGRSQTTSNNIHAFLWEKGVIKDLGSYGGNFLTSEARSINNAGVVVGQSPSSVSRERKAFYWNKGEMLDLGSLDHNLNFAIANSVNNKGAVVGFSSISYSEKYGHQYHAFYYGKDEMIDLGTLLENNLGGSVAYGINDRNQVVGYSNDSDGSSSAFLWENGTMTSLSKLEGFRHCIANSISNREQVVGYCSTSDGTRHATLWSRFNSELIGN